MYETVDFVNLLKGFRKFAIRFVKVCVFKTVGMCVSLMSLGRFAIRYVKVFVGNCGLLILIWCFLRFAIMCLGVHVVASSGIVSFAICFQRGAIMCLNVYVHCQAS